MQQTTKDKITWIDVLKPSNEEITSIGTDFNLHPLITEELRAPSARSKVEHHEHYLYLVSHFPMWDEQVKTSRAVEVDFLLLKDHLITVRYEDSIPFREIFSKCSQNPEECRQLCSETPAHLLYEIFERMFQFTERQLVHIGKKIELVELGIFKRGKERKMIRVIAQIKHDLLDFRRILKPLASILESLEIKGARFYGEELHIYFQDLRGDYNRVANIADNYTETLESLEETNNALLSFKINDVMRVFTIMAFLTFPLMVFLQLLEISEFGEPLIQSVYGFWILLGSIAGIIILLIAVFRWKRWL